MNAPSVPPRVSIVMPVHNGARFVREAIESVLQQTFGDFEFIIVDDASTDDSLARIREFRDPRIRLLSNERNLGFGGNWNRCLEEACGDYVKLLPQDDVLHPDCLRRQVSLLDADRDGKLALVFCARQIIGPSGRHLLRRGHGYRQKVIGSQRLLRHAVRWGTNPIGEPGAVLFRRSLAEQVGPFDGTRPYIIDLDYWLRLLRYGSAAYLPETLCAFRVSRQSQSVAISRRQSNEFAQFIEVLAENTDYPINALDRGLGKRAARLRALARMLVYRLALGQRSDP